MIEQLDVNVSEILNPNSIRPISTAVNAQLIANKYLPNVITKNQDINAINSYQNQNNLRLNGDLEGVLINYKVYKPVISITTKEENNSI